MRHQVSHLCKIHSISCYNGRTSINVAVLLETEFEPSFGKQGITRTKFSFDMCCTVQCDLTDVWNSLQQSV